MKKAIMGTGAVAAVMLAGAAIAEADGSLADKFSAMDGDGDGSVTQAEFTAYASAEGQDAAEAELKFAVMAGRDGILTFEELEAVMAVQEKADNWEASTVTDAGEEPGEDASTDGDEY